VGAQLCTPASTAVLAGSTLTLFMRGGPALHEALQRHLMIEAVRPSMEHYVRQQEKKALKVLDTPPQTEENSMQRLRTHLKHSR
jgi:DNA/RNA-binding domain of Phe-tRNA-synthetase-like protein